MKTCFIVGAGEFFETSLPVAKGDCVIAADGGFKYLRKLEITPDILVADFDSLSFHPQGVETVELSERKDDTDMAKAVKIGLEKGCKIFHIYGGTGGRVDHTFANIQLLNYIAKNGGKGYLYGKDCCMTVLTEGAITFGEGSKGFISVFALDVAAEVSESGLKYELSKHTLKNDFPLGVSNEFIGAKSEVAVHSGSVLIVYSR